MEAIKWEELDFITPPECGGQLVEVSYAADFEAGYVYRRKRDRSVGETTIHRSRILVDDECDYWNGRPANKRWKRIA